MAHLSSHIHAHPAPTRGGSGIVEEIAAVIAATTSGATAAHVARALAPGRDDEVAQGTLDEVVARGLLDRHGRGRGALYTSRTPT